MDKLKAVNLSRSIISNIILTEKIWEDTVDELTLYLTDFLVLNGIKDEAELKKLKFHSHESYYFHPCLCISNNKLWYALLVKIAMHDNRSKGKKSNITQFIYAKDKAKNLEARKLPQSTRDRFDGFKCGTETVKETGKINLRHNGTFVGQGAYGIDRRAEFREGNKEFWHGHSYGFSSFNKDRKLVCPMFMTQCEKVPDLNTKTLELEYADIFEIHHVLFDKGVSVHKTLSPSDYMNTDDYRNFSQAVLEELLGCMILSVNAHDIVHRRQTDGMDDWAVRLKHNQCFFLPYHWLSASNYNETLKHLEGVCKHFKASNALSYTDFKKKHSKSWLIENPIIRQSLKS